MVFNLLQSFFEVIVVLRGFDHEGHIIGCFVVIIVVGFLPILLEGEPATVCGDVSVYISVERWLGGLYLFFLYQYGMGVRNEIVKYLVSISGLLMHGKVYGFVVVAKGYGQIELCNEG